MDALVAIPQVTLRRDLDEILLVREKIDVKGQRARQLKESSSGRRLRLLHFNKSPSAADREELRGDGVRLLGKYGSQT